MRQTFLLLFILFQALAIAAQTEAHIYQINNINGEDRTALYGSQLSNINWCLFRDDLKFSTNIVLKFSRDTRLNLDSLDKVAMDFRKIVPKKFWSSGVSASRLDTKPNEDGKIWFESIFVHADAKGNIKPLAACKVIFEGTNPSAERVNPRILDIIIVLDKAALKKYNDVIKKLLVANNVPAYIPRKYKGEIKIGDKPPEEKIKN